MIVHADGSYMINDVLTGSGQTIVSSTFKCIAYVILLGPRYQSDIDITPLALVVSVAFQPIQYVESALELDEKNHWLFIFASIVYNFTHLVTFNSSPVPFVTLTHIYSWSKVAVLARVVSKKAVFW